MLTNISVNVREPVSAGLARQNNTRELRIRRDGERERKGDLFPTSSLVPCLF